MALLCYTAGAHITEYYEFVLYLAIFRVDQIDLLSVRLFDYSTANTLPGNICVFLIQQQYFTKDWVFCMENKCIGSQEVRKPQIKDSHLAKAL